MQNCAKLGLIIYHEEGDMKLAITPWWFGFDSNDKSYVSLKSIIGDGGALYIY
jgi:hypothetical protein